MTVFGGKEWSRTESGREVRVGTQSRFSFIYTDHEFIILLNSFFSIHTFLRPFQRNLALKFDK